MCVSVVVPHLVRRQICESFNGPKQITNSTAQSNNDHMTGHIKYIDNEAVLYYTSCWDCVGMKFDIVGIDPNSRHPKPRPPQDLFKTLLFLYQKENYRNT